MTTQKHHYIPGNHLLDYASVRARNRDAFLLNSRRELNAFGDLDNRLYKIAFHLGSRKTRQGHARLSLVPFILILMRQGREAFECFSRYQSAQGWLVFRPGLEATLIMSKFVDDPENAQIWKNKEARRNEYNKTFQGRSLIARSLPWAKEFQGVMRKINEQFMHANYTYYFRDASLETPDEKKLNIRLSFFDEEDPHRAHLLSFLHMSHLLASSIGKMFARDYGEHPDLAIEINSVENEWADEARSLASKNAELSNILRDLGLWAL